MPVKTYEELSSLCSQILQARGATPQVADRVAQHLAGSNLLGIDSHGVMRLAHYVSWLEEGKVAGEDKIEIVKNKGATCLIDAHFSFGPLCGSRAAEIAVKMAGDFGVGIVSVKNATHTGRLGEYVEDIARQGLIGFICANAQGYGQFVAPWGGKEARLTTNPLAWGFPSGRKVGPMVLDLATSASPEGKIRNKMRQGDTIPQGWVINSDGQPTTNPADLYGPPPGAVMPFGEHKGYALALAVEILSGGLSGGGCVRPVEERFTNENAFLLFAIEVEAFRSLSNFTGDIDDMLSYVKSSSPIHADGEVMVPYEIESKEKQRRLNEGIFIDDTTWKEITQLANG